MVTEVNNPALWKSLINDASPSMQLQIKDALQGPSKFELIKTINHAKLITDANRDVMESKIRATFKIVAGGKQEVNENGLFGRLESNIAEDFPTPATDANEILERLKKLVPHPDHLTREKTLFDHLVKAEAFTTTRPEDNRHCPAIGLTKKLFDAWGRVIHESPEYTARFTKTVQKKED